MKLQLSWSRCSQNITSPFNLLSKRSGRNNSLIKMVINCGEFSGGNKQGTNEEKVEKCWRENERDKINSGRGGGKGERNQVGGGSNE